MRAFLVVLDGVGIGALPDAAAYGDAGSDTLAHVGEAVGGLRLPTLERLGLGRIAPLPGVRVVADPRGARGRLAQASPGKDSTTGHWELAGLILERLAERLGRGFMGNVVGSGTDVMRRFGAEHQRTGRLIVYTSADSVFQIAAHEATVPLDALYDACQIVRESLDGEHAVGRVIARPFVGAEGDYRRANEHRRDFSLAPPGATLLDRLVAKGEPVVTVGKVDDLFAGRGVTDAIHTQGNADGEAALLDLARREGRGLVFANLVDFDQLYGHRNDPAGFARALEQFDGALERLLDRLRADELVIVTADHGNDPTTPSTDHSREYVPLLVAGPRVRAGADVGTRRTFADVAATLATVFGVTPPARATSFLREIRA